MTADELRAMTAQGPAVIMVQREDMLKLLDEREQYAEIRVANRRMAVFTIGAASLWLWAAILGLGRWANWW